MPDLERELSPRQSFLVDVLTTAIEGGIGYWSRVMDAKRLEDGRWTEATIVDLPEAERLGVEDVDAAFDAKDLKLSPAVHKLNAATIRKGLAAMRREQPSRYSRDVRASDRENEAGDIDTDLADDIIQFGALGKLEYA